MQTANHFNTTTCKSAHLCEAHCAETLACCALCTMSPESLVPFPGLFIFAMNLLNRVYTELGRYRRTKVGW